MGKEILLGVSGGVACYKSAMICSKLVQQGHGVSVILTSAAQEFIGAATFAALSGRAVSTSSFESNYPLGPHIELAKRAEIMLVAPATANLLAKVANGIADDLLSTTLLSFTGTIYFAPAMNAEMWNKASVQRNVAQDPSGWHSDDRSRIGLAELSRSGLGKDERAGQNRGDDFGRIAVFEQSLPCQHERKYASTPALVLLTEGCCHTIICRFNQVHLRVGCTAFLPN